MNAHATEVPKPDLPRYRGLPDIPAMHTLAAHGQWVLWQYRQRAGRWTKPLFDAESMLPASTTNPTTWADFATASAKARGYKGVGLGFVLSADDNLTGVDLDHVRNPETEALEPWVNDLIALGETYGEVSPSGTGVHLFVAGKVPEATVDNRASVEIYPHSRYLTVTGNQLPGTPDSISPAPRTLAALQARVDEVAATTSSDFRQRAERMRADNERKSAPYVDDPLGKFHDRVNRLSLSSDERIGEWLPMLHSRAFRNGCAWRITSEDLGRDLEEDVSITTSGIVDFGVADMGDPREGKRTAIDLVIEGWQAEEIFKTKPSSLEAAVWLCERMGVDPVAYGYRPAADKSEKPEAAEQPKRKIRPSPWVYQDPTTMPMLRFTFGRHYMRTVLSGTFAAGETGKSSLSLVEAVSMASGRDLLGKGLPEGRVKVWVWNGEDDLPLLNKRVAAICLFHGIKREELEGWLFLDSGVDTPLCLAKPGRSGTELQQEDLDQIRDGIREMGVDVGIFDPFIATHEIPESDNTGIGLVVKALSKIAAETNTALDIVHHVRKSVRGSTAEVDIEDGRGAGSFKDKIRSGRVLGKMTPAEGKKVGIDRPRGYFWVKNGKANLSPPPPDVRDWYHLASVKLGNDPAQPSDQDDVFRVGGDDIGVVEKWEYPSAADGVDDADLAAVKLVVAAGEYRRDGQATAWVGKAVAEALKLNIHDTVNKAKVVGLLKQWLASGDLKTEDRKDSRSEVRTFVVVGRP